MSRVYFFVVDTTGAILRTGTCVEDDAPLQGASVVVSDLDLGITGATHRFDALTQTFQPLSGDQNDRRQ